MEGASFPLATFSCVDPRLTKLLERLDGGKCHRERRFGGALILSVNKFEIATFLAMINSLEGAEFKNVIFLAHDNCAAMERSTFFYDLRHERMMAQGLGFHDERQFQRGVLKRVADNCKGNSTPIYFGVINTQKAETVSSETSVEQIINEMILWVDDKKPPRDLFEQ